MYNHKIMILFIKRYLMSVRREKHICLKGINNISRRFKIESGRVSPEMALRRETRNDKKLDLNCIKF